MKMENVKNLQVASEIYKINIKCHIWKTEKKHYVTKFENWNQPIQGNIGPC